MWSDVHLAIEDMFAEGDKVVARGIMGGIHQGDEIWGVPATGKQVTWTWISIFRFAGGKIVELWNIYDALGVLRQIGAVTPPGQSEEQSL